MITRRVFRSSLCYALLPLALVGCGGDSVIARDRKPVVPDGGVETSGGGAPLDGSPGVLASVQSCDTASHPIPPVASALCEANGWCWDSPTPSGRDARSIARVGDATWVATHGGLLSYDGAKWVPIDTPVKEPTMLLGWSSGSALLVGDSIALFDGKTWTPMTIPRLEIPPYVTGSAPDNLWAIALLQVDGGSETTTLHYDGKAWSIVNDAPPIVNGFDVVSPSDVWAYAAEDYYVEHYDGKTWSTIDLGQSGGASIVWEAAPNDVWIGGANLLTGDLPARPPGPNQIRGRGILFRWNGKTLTQVALPDGVGAIDAIYGTSPNDVWFGTTEGEYLHWDGSRVSSAPSTETRSVTSFAETKDGKLFAVAFHGQLEGTGAIDAYDGTKWASGRAGDSIDYPKKIWGSAWNDVWAVGTDGLRLHYDGTAWNVTTRASSGINGIWGSAQNDVWTVSDDGSIDHFDGTSWSTAYQAPGVLTAVSGIGNGELWVTGDSSSSGFDVARFDGNTLHPYTLDFQSPVAIYAAGTRDVWVGGTSAVRHFDGETWSDPAGLEQALANAYAPIHYPPDASVGGGEGFGIFPWSAIWGSGPNSVWLAADDNLVVHFDGAHWSYYSIGHFDNTGAVALGGCGDHDVFFASDTGISHFDGTAWTTTPTNSALFTGVWAASANYAIAVGSDDQILRRSE